MQTTETIFVNGTFDVLHVGHIYLLEYAASLGNQLVVALDSDERVKNKKGAFRPFNNLQDRMKMVSSLKCVDIVESFGTDKELERLVKKYGPEFMVVGSDWRGKHVIGSQYAKEIDFFERIPDYSTTDILENRT